MSVPISLVSPHDQSSFTSTNQAFNKTKSASIETNTPLDQQKKEYTYFTFQDSNTGIQTQHKICLNTDTNMICDAKTKDTWLHIAVEADNELMLRGFLKNDPSINLEVRNAKDFTPLMTSIETYKEQSVFILLEAGADIYAQSKTCSSALCLAAKTHIRIMNIIFESFEKAGKKLNLEFEEESKNPLFAAIRGKQPEIAEKLILKGANINKAYQAQNLAAWSTPLSAAAFAHETRIVKFLLTQGAQVVPCLMSYVTGYDDNVKAQISSSIASPLFGAVINCKDEDEELVNALIAAGDDPHQVLSDNSNLIHWAVKNPKSSSSVLKLLLSLRVDPNLRRNSDRATPLLIASNLEHITLLLDYGAEVDAVDNQGQTLLYKECYLLDNADRVKLLLERGADPNSGFYAFIISAYRNPGIGSVTVPHFTAHRHELTQLFFAKGAKMNGNIRKIIASSNVIKNDERLKQLFSDNDPGCIVS